MQEESACNQGPVFSSNMDVNLAKNRGLLQATSNADNKNVRGKLLQVLLKFTYSTVCLFCHLSLALFLLIILESVAKSQC